MASVYCSGNHIFHLAAGANATSLPELPEPFDRADVFFPGHGDAATVATLLSTTDGKLKESQTQFLFQAGFRGAHSISKTKIREEESESNFEIGQPPGIKTQRSAGAY